MIQAALDEVLDTLPPGGVVLDPACGDGRWLLAVAQRRPDAVLWGWDVDPEALALAREVLGGAGVRAELHPRDTLEGEERGVADLIVGNPPWVRPQHLPEAQRRRVWARYHTATDKCDLYAPFTERCLELGRGPAALVLGDTWLSMASFAALRARVLAEPVDLLAALPRGSFAATVGSVLLVLRPEGRRRRGRLGPEGLHVEGALRPVGGLLPLVEAPELDGAGTLGDRWRLRMGVVCGGYDTWVHRGPPGPLDRPTLRGRDVARFALHDRGEWLRYDPAAMLAARPYVAPKHAGLFDVPAKVVLSGGSGVSLRAAVDTGRRFPLDSCYVSEGSGDVWALCAVLNSSVVNGWYAARYPAVRVKAVELHGLPWPAGDLRAAAEAARAADPAGVDEAVARAYGG